MMALKKQRKRKSTAIVMKHLRESVSALAKAVEEIAKGEMMTEDDRTHTASTQLPSQRQTPNPGARSIEKNNNKKSPHHSRQSKEGKKKRGGVDTVSVERKKKEGKKKTSKTEEAEKPKSKCAKEVRPKTTREELIAKGLTCSPHENPTFEDVPSDWVTTPPIREAHTQGSLSQDCTQDLDSTDEQTVSLVKGSEKEGLHTAVEMECVAVEKPKPQPTAAVANKPPASEFPELYYEVGRTYGSTIVKYNKCRLIKYQEKNAHGNYKLWCRKCHYVFTVKNYKPRQYGQRVQIIGTKGRAKC